MRHALDVDDVVDDAEVSSGGASLEEMFWM